MKNLVGKVAIVTGASRGIGRAIALCLADAGADVVVNYAGNQSAAEHTVAEIETIGRKAIAMQADVGKAEQAEQLVTTTLAQFGRVDIMINNAGITRDNVIMRMKEEQFDQVIETNLKGVFHCIKAVTRPMMKQRFGRIINISSIVGVTGNAGQANYAAAKAGVIGLTKASAKELASRGITVNGVAPGFITTDMTAILTSEVKEKLLQQIPLQHFGQPEHIAKVVHFLASDAADYMTGQMIHVDGGLHM